jgi:hypothetical protein
MDCRAAFFLGISIGIALGVFFKWLDKYLGD